MFISMYACVCWRSRWLRAHLNAAQRMFMQKRLRKDGMSLRRWRNGRRRWLLPLCCLNDPRRCSQSPKPDPSSLDGTRRHLLPQIIGVQAHRVATATTGISPSCGWGNKRGPAVRARKGALWAFCETPGNSWTFVMSPIIHSICSVYGESLH